MAENTHPELAQFMDNLLQAGMNTEDVMRYSYECAFKLIREGREFMSIGGFGVVVYEGPLMVEASHMVRATADELQISLKFQRMAERERRR